MWLGLSAPAGGRAVGPGRRERSGRRRPALPAARRPACGPPLNTYGKFSQVREGSSVPRELFEVVALL